MISQQWDALPREQREEYQIRFDEELEKYKKELQAYTDLCEKQQKSALKNSQRPGKEADSSPYSENKGDRDLQAGEQEDLPGDELLISQHKKLKTKKDRGCRSASKGKA